MLFLMSTPVGYAAGLFVSLMRPLTQLVADPEIGADFVLTLLWQKLRCPENQGGVRRSREEANVRYLGFALGVTAFNFNTYSGYVVSAPPLAASAGSRYFVANSRPLSSAPSDPGK